MLSLLVNPPLSLYVHTPWCIRKCPYCDFNSHTLQQSLPENEYVDALINDLRNHLTLIHDRKIHSIFIGGGTPSLFSASAYERLFKKLQCYVNVPENIEITLEANPGTVEQTRFNAYRALGINRLSLGIQSLQNAKLKILGRIHSAADSIRAVESAKKAGFCNINLDLMYGLPKQTFNEALCDLKTAVELQPTHLSWYQLTIEPNTYFHQFPPILPTDDLAWKMQTAGHALLKEHGFEHYEVSAHSKPNYHCKHNINYWKFGDYLGIGAGAHSKITNIYTGIVGRHWNHKHPKDYLAATPSYVANDKIVTIEELPLEFMMNALRLHSPIPTRLFSERTGLPLSAIQESLREAEKQGFLRVEQQHFVVSSWGKRYLNDLLSIFMPY